MTRRPASGAPAIVHVPWLRTRWRQALGLASVIVLATACSTRPSSATRVVPSLTVVGSSTAAPDATATRRVVLEVTSTRQPDPTVTETAIPVKAPTPAHLDLSIIQTVTAEIVGSSAEISWDDAYGLVLVKGRDDIWVQTSGGRRLALTDLTDLSWLAQRDFLAIATDGRSLVVHGRREDQERGFQFHLSDATDDVRVADSLSPCGFFGWVKPDVLVCGEYLDSTSNTLLLKSYYDPHDGVLHSIPDVIAYNGIFAVSPDRTQILILPEAASGMLLIDTRTGLTTTVLPWIKPFEALLSENFALEWSTAGVTLATTQSNGITIVGPLRSDAFQEADPPRRVVSFPATTAEWTNTEMFWHDEGLRHIGVLRAAPNDAAGDDQPRYLFDHWLIDTENGEGTAYLLPQSMVMGTVRASPDDRFWAWQEQDGHTSWVQLLDCETGRMSRLGDSTDVIGWWVLP